ncbi:MAG: formylmethanofuran dehydrogenase subunit B [Thermodesulfobacteriota bacterium]|nr:formylmethanofuran dehydrogenase subunit B [Thermodesulfobacteriota bacterium]
MSEILFESVVCPSCACLCDDIDIIVEQNKVKTIRNICEWGISKFLFTKRFTSDIKRGRVQKPMIKKETLIETDYKTAVSEAVHILQASKKPLVYGLTNSGYHAQKFALMIAKKLKGYFEPRGSALFGPYYKAMHNSNFYMAPLEEIKNNADFILYWGCNPIHSTPRHLTRYSVYPKGRAKEKGSRDRIVFSVDIAQNELSGLPHKFVQVEPGTDFLVINTLLRLIKGESAEDYHGDIVSLKNMVKYMVKSSYGVIFFGWGLCRNENPTKNITALLNLVKELNNTSRFFVLPLYDDFNTNGAVQLLIRERGSPLPADFSVFQETGCKGYTLLDNLDEIDAVLIVGEDPFWSLPPNKSELLKDKPIILVDPFWTRTTNKCQVVFPAAITGVETEGIAYRMDGLPLYLKSVIKSEYPSDESILKDIFQCLR